MIHEIGVQLHTALAAAGIPIPVIDGPERRTTTTFARERVVIERSGEDSFASRHRANVNPVPRLSRVIACKLTIYAQRPSKGAAEYEHFRRAEAMLDQVLIALYTIAKERKNILELKSGKFIYPDDLKAGETMGGAVYELHFTIDRVVDTTSWAGQIAPQVSIPNGMLETQTQVSIEGGTPEIVD